jgi:hypothetical protein
MEKKSSGWEGPILAFAMIFTVLIGLANVAVAILDRGSVPWLIILLVSIGVAIGLRYIPRQSKQ